MLVVAARFAVEIDRGSLGCPAVAAGRHPLGGKLLRLADASNNVPSTAKCLIGDQIGLSGVDDGIKECRHDAPCSRRSRFLLQVVSLWISWAVMVFSNHAVYH